MVRTSVLAACLATVTGLVSAQNFNGVPNTWDPDLIGTSKDNATFMNPIYTRNVGDPYVTRYSHDGEDWYLITFSTNDNITLKRTKSLTDDWEHLETRVVFNPDPKEGKPWSTDLWAPEIHSINGSWYVIFSATPDFDRPKPLLDAMCPINCPAINHRMFALEGKGPDPWTANFTLKPMIDTYDQFAIDGTYFIHKDQLYHIYSCWTQKFSAWPANLCITKMSDPWTVTSNLAQRRMISVPDQAWERVPYGREDSRLATNEGPQQLINPKTGQNFVIYSAARVNTPFYCLGMLELIGDDPMEYQSWKKHKDGCVFHQNTETGVYGTGHASFTTSPDGEEDYIVYHAITTNDPSDLYRTVRTQKFTWNEDGTPNFPRPANGPFPVPSGQKGQRSATERSLPRRMGSSWGSA